MDLHQWKKINSTCRKYTHFDCRRNLDEVWEYISDPVKIKKHGFYPFIHFEIKSVKFHKDKGGKNKKSRKIYYSAHIDRFIYKYYAFKINQLYNERMQSDGLNEVSIAYRDVLKRNNIHFAKAAFDFIRSRSECLVIIGDFTSFFDSLDHKYLKKMLCDLLQVKSLSEDYYAIYKNITKFSKIDLEDLLEINGFKKEKSGVKKFNSLKRAVPIELLKTCMKKVDYNKNSYGIPQGSAISAVFSNVYMIEFDRLMYDFAKNLGGLYLRYSDDFIIAIPNINMSEYSRFKADLDSFINKIPKLELEVNKTQLFHADRGNIFKIDSETDSVSKSVINYLGFAFDGNDVSIRDKTTSKYYQRLYRKFINPIKNNGITKKGNRVSFKVMYDKYSIKGSFPSANYALKKDNTKKFGNFLTYVRRAKNVFKNEKKIDLIMQRHMYKIRKKIKLIKQI